MKRTKAGSIAIFTVLLLAIGVMAGGCYSGKKCGCGTDLNSVWKPNKRYR